MPELGSSLQFAVCSLQFAVCSLQFAVCSLVKKIKEDCSEITLIFFFIKHMSTNTKLFTKHKYHLTAHFTLITFYYGLRL